MKSDSHDYNLIPEFIEKNERILNTLPSSSQLMNVVSSLRLKGDGIDKAKGQIYRFGNKRTEEYSGPSEKPKPKPMLKHEWKTRVTWAGKDILFDDMMIEVIDSCGENPANYMDVLVHAIIASREKPLLAKLWKGAKCNAK